MYQHCRQIVIASVLLLVFLCGQTPLCAQVIAPCAVEEYASREKTDFLPRVPGEVWQRYVSPEEAGWSSERLQKARSFSKEIGSAAVMIIYDGAVLDQWGDTLRRFRCHSVRKSFLSALYGIYVGRGKIDISKTLKELGIDDVPALTESEQRARIVDLLCARSGVYHSAAYETSKMKEGRPRRGAHAPGELFWYNNWDFNALGTIFEQETGSTIFGAFQQQLAIPLQMQDFERNATYYHFEKENSIHPAYTFRMSARDMARFGLLYLRRGQWGEKQIVPEWWVDASTTSHFCEGDKASYPEYGYGYLWWVVVDGPLKKFGMYSARGSGGHVIDVLPAANLVIVHRFDTFWKLGARFRPDSPGVKSPARFELIKLILQAHTGSPKAEPRLVPVEEPPKLQPAFKLSPNFCKNAAGTYDFGKFRLVITAEVAEDDPKLFIACPEREYYRLIPLSKTEFEIEDIELHGSFGLDASGMPTQITIEFMPGEAQTGIKQVTPVSSVP